ncbi:hypothetical protein SAMN04487830_10755 [Pseudobutyrivibrio sp. OR37]|uniref:hypothetical protein n=1 Tax=Pseudobutyrivibrio sp. OR37 TaxID=1798186 RepID=UPI0008E3A0DD|nr:hypothetical protein [Pseudobutyrivibrio sp. OR37]SFH75218.1 hypothetical protein SAMN04487830_10755 [Pseudobutyrivibrio sp. OR37]
MKKFLSKVLTLALVCAIVVTGTSITSEAKGKNSAKKAVATTYSTNAVVNDLVATGLKSNGLVIGGKSYDSQQLITLGYEANPAVTVSPMYESRTENSHIYYCGFELYADGAKGTIGSTPKLTYDSGMAKADLDWDKAYGWISFGEDAILNTDGVWNKDAFIANGINTQYICSWMQSRGLNTASDVYNYLVANGVTFTDKSYTILGDNPVTIQRFVCNQCPDLSYEIDTATGETEIGYFNENQSSGVNGFRIESYTDDGRIVTNWNSGLRYHNI